ncbi:MAG TPA: hypothetical protein VGR07_09520 [Thermoanaerobaculia bacterium]|jgi:hypothetical protein|nr:hypothetical protein [Thermoanaerobaculia bacterium]
MPERADQLGVRGQQVFQRAHVASVDGGYRCAKVRAGNLGFVH